MIVAIIVLFLGLLAVGLLQIPMAEWIVSETPIKEKKKELTK